MYSISAAAYRPKSRPPAPAWANRLGTSTRMDVRRTDLGSIPALATGNGPPLVWLNGVAPESGVDRRAMRRANLSAVAPYAQHRRVYFTNRRPGLPAGMTMAELAAEHADGLRAAFPDRPVDVLGVSTGGSIAQQLAADHPDVIARLVLQSTACRLGPHGLELQRRMAVLLVAGKRRRALALLGASVVPPRRGQLVAGAVSWLIGPRLFPVVADFDDMATVLQAEDSFDLARCPTPILAPTLLVAGRADRFYAPELFDETAALIPDCATHLLDRRGHVSALRHPSVVPTVVSFLTPG